MAIVYTADERFREASLAARARSIAGLAVAIGIGIAAAAVMIWYDPTAGAVVPVGAIAVALMIYYPFWGFVVLLAQFSIIPIEGHLFGFFVPNLTQLFVPGLMLAIIARRVLRREWGAFRFCFTDWVVVAWLVLAYAGIFLMPGHRYYKYFTNQEAFPAMMYFAARWLDIDHERFRYLLWGMLGTTLSAVFILALRPFTGWEPWGQGGRGPLGAFSDATAYFAIWPVFFLYAGHRAMEEGRRRMAFLWFAGVPLSLFAVTGTHERSGLVAAVLALLICALRPGLRRRLLIGAFVFSPLIIAWGSTSVWQSLHQRFKEPDPGLRRRLYRMKAINYIRSREWNPLLGTGFGRLAGLSVNKIPETLYVYDPKWQAWRSARGMVRRAIHCAPLTIYGEYGMLGTAALALFFMLLIAQSIRLYIGDRRIMRGPPDRDLIVAAWAAAAGVILNGIYHNTDTVVPVLFMCWAFSGILVGHPEAFLLHPTGKAVSSGVQKL